MCSCRIFLSVSKFTYNKVLTRYQVLEKVEDLNKEQFELWGVDIWNHLALGTYNGTKTILPNNIDTNLTVTTLKNTAVKTKTILNNKQVI